MSTLPNDDFPRGTGASSLCHATRMRNHAGVLAWLLLLVPLAEGTGPDRAYIDELAQHLSSKLPGLTADGLELSVQPDCSAEQVELRGVRSNMFGGSTVTLRCGGSHSLPFTALAKSGMRYSRPVDIPILKRGSTVRLEIAAQGLVIHTTARALACGSIGDTIPVRTARRNRIVRARVIDASSVRATIARGQQ